MVHYILPGTLDTHICQLVFLTFQWILDQELMERAVLGSILEYRFSLLHQHPH